MRKLHFVPFILLFSSQLLAGLGTIAGNEEGYWTEGKRSLVIATIHDLRREPGEGFQPYRATLKPIAMLAGTLDASVQASVDVRFHVSDLTSSIRNPSPWPRMATLCSL